jgi:hypothetical protein
MLNKLVSLVCVGVLSLAARSQTPCYEENGGPNFNDGFSTSGVYVGIQFTAPAVGFQATRIEMFTGEATGPSSVAIWAHDAVNNQPLASLGSGAFTLLPPNSWQGGNLAAPVPLVPNQTYWLVWLAVSGCQSPLDVPMLTLGQPYRPSFDNCATWGNLFQFVDRHWKFRIFGTCSVSTTYCTAGTTTNGCVPSIAGTGVPSASANSGFTIACTNVEGQKSGIVFYGIAGRVASPWATGSTSILCVKAPTQRMGTQNSGGTLNSCNGTLAIDWNAFRAANPTALGAPFASGSLVNAQGWFRDPPAPKTTNLTNAVEFVVQP